MLERGTATLHRPSGTSGVDKVLPLTALTKFPSTRKHKSSQNGRHLGNRLAEPAQGAQGGGSYVRQGPRNASPVQDHLIHDSSRRATEEKKRAGEEPGNPGHGRTTAEDRGLDQGCGTRRRREILQRQCCPSGTKTQLRAKLEELELVREGYTSYGSDGPVIGTSQRKHGRHREIKGRALHLFAGCVRPSSVEGACAPGA
eukprot:gene9889-7767_t